MVFTSKNQLIFTSINVFYGKKLTKCKKMVIINYHFFQFSYNSIYFIIIIYISYP